MSDPAHPSDDQLAAFLAGELSADAFERIDGHVVDCEPCQGRLVELAEADGPREAFLVDQGTVHSLPEACIRMMREAQRLADEDAKSGGDDEPDHPVDPDAITIGVDPESESDDVRPAAYARGDVFGDYVIVREIARGGMGVVFLARQTSLNRDVAIKMILDSRLASEEAVRRFRAEAESAARLDHPGIVPVFEVGNVGGQQYFSMGYVNGCSLRQQLDEEGPLDSQRAAGLLGVIARTVQYAHTRNIVHRDLKPANVLIDGEGVPKLTDFGLAKDFESGQHLTSDGQVLGTPHYMAPEQAAGRKEQVGPLSDVYSLGAILYHLVSSRPPFAEASVFGTLNAVVNDEPPSPRKFNPNVDADLVTICLKCLEKDPARRYNSAGDVADELDRYLTGVPIEARSISVPERIGRWFRRNPRVLWGMVATILVMVGAVVYAAFGLERVASSLESQLDVTVANDLKSSAGWVAEAAERELSAKYRQTQIASSDLLRKDLLEVVRNPVQYENAKDLLAKWHHDAMLGAEGLAIPTGDCREDPRPLPPYPEFFAKIQAWVDSDPSTIGPDLWNGAGPEVSYNVLAWWVCGPDGYQIARDPMVPVRRLDFAYRSYFTGRPSEAKKDEPPPMPDWEKPDDGPRLSPPFLTQETNCWVIAISVPVFEEPRADGRKPDLLGVVGMFVELGALIQTDDAPTDESGRIAILIDDRHDDDKARILEHPILKPKERRDFDEVAKVTMPRSNWSANLAEDPFADEGLDNTERFRGRWRSAYAFVDLEGDDGKLIALVREPEEVIADPSRQLRINLRSLGIAIVGLFLIPPLVALVLATRRR